MEFKIDEKSDLYVITPAMGRSEKIAVRVADGAGFVETSADTFIFSGHYGVNPAAPFIPFVVGGDRTESLILHTPE